MYEFRPQSMLRILYNSIEVAHCHLQKKAKAHYLFTSQLYKLHDTYMRKDS